MKVHEYQAKELLKTAGVAVPEGIVVTEASDAAKAYDSLGGGLIVVKAQVHAGGRGKGVAIGPGEDRQSALEFASGRKPRPETMARGVQLVRSAQEAQRAAASLLGKTLVTYQTGIDGHPRSPVSNQPDAKASRVASGLCQYSLNRFGPRSCTEPTSPTVAGTPLSVTTRISTPSSGNPTEPAGHGPSSGRLLMTCASVMP